MQVHKNGTIALEVTQFVSRRGKRLPALDIRDHAYDDDRQLQSRRSDVTTVAIPSLASGR